MEASRNECCVIMRNGVLLTRRWWHEGPQPASWCQVEGQNAMEFWIRKSLELSFAVILWYWFVNSANFVVYLTYFTNIRQKTRDCLLYTRFLSWQHRRLRGRWCAWSRCTQVFATKPPPKSEFIRKNKRWKQHFLWEFWSYILFGVWRCEASDVPAINRGQGHRTTTSKYRLLVQGKAAGVQLRISPLRLRLVVNCKEHDRENDGNAAGRVIYNCLRASTTWGTALMAREREREMLASKVKPKMNFCLGRPLLGWWLDLICVVMFENLMQSPRSPMSSLKCKKHG